MSYCVNNDLSIKRIISLMETEIEHLAGGLKSAKQLLTIYKDVDLTTDHAAAAAIRQALHGISLKCRETDQSSRHDDIYTLFGERGLGAAKDSMQSTLDAIERNAQKRRDEEERARRAEEAKRAEEKREADRIRELLARHPA